MLAVLADLNLLRTFVRSLIDILQYIQVGVSNRTSKMKQQKSDALKASLSEDTQYVAQTPSVQFVDENAELMVTWPTNKDRKVTGLFYSFFNDSASCGRWTSDIASAHISILWVMLLRFQCGLRGLKASKLVGKDIYQMVDTVAEINADVVANFEQVQ